MRQRKKEKLKKKRKFKKTPTITNRGAMCNEQSHFYFLMETHVLFFFNFNKKVIYWNKFKNGRKGIGWGKDGSYFVLLRIQHKIELKMHDLLYDLSLNSLMHANPKKFLLVLKQVLSKRFNKLKVTFCTYAI